jgi:hypothetical protein
MAPQSGFEPEFQPSQGRVLSIVRKRYWWTSKGIEPFLSECKTDVLPLSLAALCRGFLAKSPTNVRIKGLFNHKAKW